MWAIDIKTDPGCSWTTDLAMVFGSSLGLDHILLLVKPLATQILMVLVAAWPPDTTKASDCCLNPGLLCDLWSQYRI